MYQPPKIINLKNAKKNSIYTIKVFIQQSYGSDQTREPDKARQN